MGLMDKLRGEFIDIIEWTDDSRDTIVWRFPRYDNEIKMGAKLVCRETQTAVFVNEGKIADVFKPGMYRNITGNEAMALRRSESIRRTRADNSEPSPDDPLGIYLKDVGAHDLLEPEEEHLLLGDLILDPSFDGGGRVREDRHAPRGSGGGSSRPWAATCCPR